METFIEIFKKIFINRNDVYAVQYLKNNQSSYKVIFRTLTDKLIQKHLDFVLTIGIFAGLNKTKWLCIDIDEFDTDKIKNIAKKAQELNLNPYIEFSGQKGFHIWVFFEKPVENSKLRQLGKYLADDKKIEVFPKQDKNTKQNPGNLIKAPFGVHQKSKVASVFLDNDLSPFVDNSKFIKNIRYSEFVLPETKKITKCRYKPKTPVQITDLKQCVRDSLNIGYPEGWRNKVGFVIASELKRTGKPYSEANSVLSAWNTQNNPPLAENELQHIINSVFNKTVYEYGCNGEIKNILGCIGKDNCDYYKNYISNLKGGTR